MVRGMEFHWLFCGRYFSSRRAVAGFIIKWRKTIEVNVRGLDSPMVNSNSSRLYGIQQLVCIQLQA